MAAIAAVSTAGANMATSILKTTSAATGIDTTWSPAGFVAPGVARWENRAGGIPVGYPYFTLNLRRPVKGNRNYKVTLKMWVPTLEQVAPSVIWTKAYDCVGFLEFILPERSTQSERGIILNHIASLLATTINASDDLPTDSTGTPVRAMVRDLEDVY